MITREEIDVLFQENMNGNVLDILVQDCCNVIKGKLNYKKEYLDKEDLLFLLARLYYLDCDFREYILEIYDFFSITDKNNIKGLYDIYSKIQEINKIEFNKNTIDLAYELKYLLSIGKNEFARILIEENYYNRIFGKVLNRNNISIEDEDSFADLSKKVYKIKEDYLDKISLILGERDELERIKLLLEYSDDFSNRKLIIYNRNDLENLIEEWLFEIVYERLKNLFINKFLQMLDEESEEEDLDKLLDELYDKICSSKSEIVKECEEIKYRMTHTFATNDERNEENLNRLLDLYEFIQDK